MSSGLCFNASQRFGAERKPNHKRGNWTNWVRLSNGFTLASAFKVYGALIFGSGIALMCPKYFSEANGYYYSDSVETGKHLDILAHFK
jgi:hypothetical protein